MKTFTARPIRRRTVWLLAVGMLYVHATAQACPGCKQNVVPGADGSVPPLSGASVAFGLSIFFMIFMVVALLGGLGLMMYRSCRALALQQDAELAGTDGDAGSAHGLPARA